MTQKQKVSSKFKLYAPENLVGNPLLLNEQFKSKTIDNTENKLFKSEFRKKVGEPHPFEYITIEEIMKKFGLVSAIIDKISDFTIGPGLFIDTEDENVREILENWMDETNFQFFLEPWFKQSLAKGFSPMEIAGLSDPNKQDFIKVINANTIFIKRDDFGKVLEYNQFVGSNQGIINDKNITKLKKEEIIQLDTNKIGSSAYGIGIVHSGLHAINNLGIMSNALHKLMERKAGSPIHVKMGSVEAEDYPEQSDIDAFGSKLQFMNNCTEWVTGPNVEMKVIDFGNIAGKFEGAINMDLKILSYTFQVPETILGAEAGGLGGSGHADTQMDAFERNIKAYQQRTGFIVKSQIFDIVLKNKGKINAKYNVIWGQQNEEDKNTLRESYKEILSAKTAISPGLKKEYERKVAELDDIDFEEVEKENKRVERKENRDAVKSFSRDLTLKGTGPNSDNRTPQEMVHNLLEKGHAPQEIESELITKFSITEEKAKDMVENHDCSLHEDMNEDCELEEWIGEFLQIKQDILDIIKTDEFENLAAKEKGDIGLGKLNKKQVEKVRTIMEDAFEERHGLHKIAGAVALIGLKDRLIIRDGKKVLSLSKEKRPFAIARSETVRLRAEGSLLALKNDNQGKAKFTLVSAKPCSRCIALDGKEIPLSEAIGIIPVHSMCRCIWEEI